MMRFSFGRTDMIQHSSALHFRRHLPLKAARARFNSASTLKRAR